MTDRSRPRPLTRALTEPARVRAGALDADQSMAQALSALAASWSGGGPFRLTDYDVRTALAGQSVPRSAAPFQWSARTARRALGLAAVRALVSDGARTPTEGVRSAMAQASGVTRGERPTSRMDGWLAGLPVAARAAVGADAVTWATRLWTALDWKMLESPPVIGRDHWWDSPHSSLLALRSRAEVRTTAPGPEGDPVSTHLVVLGGPRRPTARSELSVVALVEALRAGRTPAPGRVVGWWPDSGHLVRVDVDRAALEAGLAAVARTVPAVATRRTPSGGHTEAAA